MTPYELDPIFSHDNMKSSGRQQSWLSRNRTNDRKYSCHTR
jgi:hypothetical protein